MRAGLYARVPASETTIRLETASRVKRTGRYGVGKKSAVICSTPTDRTSIESTGPLNVNFPEAFADRSTLARSSLSELCILWRAMKLLAVLYLTYSCMHLSPVRRVRRWATTTWWRLVQESPEDIWEDNLPADSPVTFARLSTFAADRSAAEEPRAA